MNERKKGIKSEIVDLMKELLLIKEEKSTMVGLSGFKRKPKPMLKRPKKKENKELKLSDLMRRA